MRKAFTLIELLVVIVIVAILAAILFPVFAQAKRAAKDSVTISNVKQLGIGFAMYEGDNEDVIPPTIHSVGGQGTVGGWVYLTALNADPSRFDVSKGVVYPYVKNVEVYKSPLDKNAALSGLSFAYNGCLTTTPGASGVLPGKFATAIDAPATTMNLGEEDNQDDGYFSPGNVFANWHTAGTAIMFVDTHAKIVKARSRYNELVYGNASLNACP